MELNWLFSSCFIGLAESSVVEKYAYIQQFYGLDDLTGGGGFKQVGDCNTRCYRFFLLDTGYYRFYQIFYWFYWFFLLKTMQKTDCQLPCWMQLLLIDHTRSVLNLVVRKSEQVIITHLISKFYYLKLKTSL